MLLVMPEFLGTCSKPVGGVVKVGLRVGKGGGVSSCLVVMLGLRLGGMVGRGSWEALTLSCKSCLTEVFLVF